MPKLKTHKGVAQRFKVTGTGKLMHARSGRRHLLTGKPARKMRQLRRAAESAPVEQGKLRRLIPYRS
ncbi:MAG: 50S ribosomal protein L35 [Candidatus Omnitrophica bacterium]|nr:50S ribosomal protein L35 [Candidatus Omnitrophota bacterium]